MVLFATLRTLLAYAGRFALTRLLLPGRVAGRL